MNICSQTPPPPPTRCTSTADVRRTFVYFMINKAKRSPSLPKLYGPPLCRTLASGGGWLRGKIRTRLGRVVLSCVSHQTANKIQYFLQICPLWWWLGHPLFILCLGFRRVVSLDSTWPPHLRRLQPSRRRHSLGAEERHSFIRISIA